MGILGGESAYELLRRNDIELLYLTRLHPAKLIEAKNSELKLGKHDLILMNKVLNHLLQTSFIDIGPEKKKVSIYDFLCFIETIYQFWRNLLKEDSLNLEIFKKKLSFFNDYGSVRIEGYLKLSDCIQLVSWLFTIPGDFSVLIYPKVSDADKSSTNPKAFYNNYVVSLKKPEAELFEIEGHKRTIFQINLYQGNEPHAVTITPKMLGINGLLKDLPLKVYIQRHALDRIKERLGDYFTGYNYAEIINMLLKPQPFRADDGGYLFPYTFQHIRLGYLKANIYGDRLIFRTFLFLTNNGTPEGKRLDQLLGVQKADKKYLGIDNLNTFMNSDIESNENLKQIFCQTGCGELFELNKIMKRNPSPSIHCADFMEKYLGLKQEEEITTPFAE